LRARRRAIAKSAARVVLSIGIAVVVAALLAVIVRVLFGTAPATVSRRSGS
jgi:hypothetical protein